MKRYFLFLPLLFVASIALSIEALAPEPQYPEIARRLVRHLQANHISEQTFGDKLSKIAWTNFMDLLDADHTLLTEEDLAKVASKQTQIDDMLHQGDLSFAYEMMALIQKRMAERYTFAQELLAKEHPFDFSKDEEYIWKRRKAPRPANTEEQKAIWRAMLKNEYLALQLSRELDAEEAAENPEKQRQKEAQKAADAEEAYVVEDDPNEPIAETILRRYRTLNEIYAEMDAETVLQRYLTAVATTYDPHTDYMSPMNFEDFSMEMNLTLCGIGATLRYDDGLIRILEVMPGGPAGRDERDVRLRPGDRIIGVAQENGEMEDVRHKPLNKTIRKIRGPKGTKVILKVIPFSDKSGTRTKIVDLVRDEIRLEEQAVSGHVEKITVGAEERRIAYARIPAFYSGVTTGDRSKNASVTNDLIMLLRDFNGQNVDGLVLDFRNNGGGSLIEALRMVGLFVSGPAVQVKDAEGVQVLPVQAPVMFRKPMVVLINRTSASASEIVAGALQDYGRAIVIGDSKTHGKGTVQTVEHLGDAKTFGAYRVTTAGFYRINGESTQLEGVASDITLPSLFDAMDQLGEDQLPGALPHTTIAPAYYAKTADLSGYIPTLKTASDKRLIGDKGYQRTQQLIAHIRKANAEQTVSLQLDKRRDRMRTERAMQEWEEEELGSSRLRDKQPTMKNDPVLREAVWILSDFIDLRGGPDEPVDTNGDIGSRLFNIFGY